MSRLAFYLDRYYLDIEADVQEVYGVELGQLVRNVKLRRVLSLIDRLPQASRFAAAVANDEEHVEMILEAQKDQPESEYSPPLSTWGTTNEQLAAVRDLLETLIAVTIQANGGKARRVKPSPRPRTKFAEAAEKMAVARHKSIVARVRTRPSPAAQVE